MRSLPCPLEKGLSKLCKDGTAIPLCVFLPIVDIVRVKDKKREYSCSQAARKDKDSVRCC